MIQVSSKKNALQEVTVKRCNEQYNGTEVDAVLAELMIKWFTEENFKHLTPFAGDRLVLLY